MGRKQKGFGKKKHKNFKIAVSRRIQKLTSENKKKNEESLETLQPVIVAEGQQNIQLFNFTDAIIPHDTVTGETFADDCIRSTEESLESTMICVPAREENFQQLEITNVLNTDNIDIEEMYVDNWMDIFQPIESFTPKCLNVPSNADEELFIHNLTGSLEESYDFLYEFDTEKKNEQRMTPSERENRISVTHEHTKKESDEPAEIHAENADQSEHESKANDDGEISSEQDLLEEEESTKTEIPIGRRIVDFFPFVEAIQRLNSHSRNNNCNFSNMRFVKEFRQGLNSIFTFACDVCKYTGTLKSNPTTNSNQQLEVNYASVLGAYAVGIGFYQSQEYLATLDVPFMAVATYDKRQKILQNDLRKLAEEVENAAMAKEKRIAVEKKEVDVKGTPLLSCYVDGSYPKRSYRTHYDSLSGTACMIGLHTKLMIWHGVKNKYCRICALAKDGEAKEHLCNRNYIGPSTGIESQLLLEAFENSEKDFGVRYQRLIADGDSKTYKVIDEAKIYRNPTLKVEKIECILHLYRCAMGLLLKVKNVSSGEAEKLLIGIKSSVKHWIASNLSDAEKIENIRKDILNAPHHIYGDHTKCNDYFCDKEKHKNDVSCIPEMKKSGMYNNIMHALARLLENAKSLLYNLNTNFPEQYNSVIAKHLGGKRVNFCTGLSYACRVDCAAISFNTGRLVSHMRMFVSGDNDLNEKTIIYKVESARLKRRKNKAKPGYLRKVTLPDKHYGTNTCQRPDMSPEVFQMLKDIHLGSLEELRKDRTKIERETKDEANSNFREQIQEDVLTADKIGKICRAATDGDFPSFVESIRYSSETVGNTKEIKHGRIFENTAIELLSDMVKLNIESCGVFIDEKYAFLGAHPTGVTDGNGIVLIKCPHSAFKMDINEAIDKRKITFWSVSRKRKDIASNESRQVVGINKKHDWYFEIQAMLHITQRTFCIFAVWSGHDESAKCIKYEYIYPDNTLWTNQMEQKILGFYYNHLLPEVIDPRKRRGMPTRGLKEADSRKKANDSGADVGENNINGQGTLGPIDDAEYKKLTSAIK